MTASYDRKPDNTTKETEVEQSLAPSSPPSSHVVSPEPRPPIASRSARPITRSGGFGQRSVGVAVIAGVSIGVGLAVCQPSQSCGGAGLYAFWPVVDSSLCEGKEMHAQPQRALSRGSPFPGWCGGARPGPLELWGPADVIVSIERWPAAATQLRVRSQLNGTAGQEQTLSSQTTRFVLRLPPQRGGEIKLDVAALDANGCRAATGSLTVPVPAGLRHYIEVTVRLSENNPPCAACVMAVKTAAARSSRPRRASLQRQRRHL